MPTLSQWASPDHGGTTAASATPGTRLPSRWRSRFAKRYQVATALAPRGSRQCVQPLALCSTLGSLTLQRLKLAFTGFTPYDYCPVVCGRTTHRTLALVPSVGFPPAAGRILTDDDGIGSHRRRKRGLLFKCFPSCRLLDRSTLNGPTSPHCVEQFEHFLTAGHL